VKALLITAALFVAGCNCSVPSGQLRACLKICERHSGVERMKFNISTETLNRCLCRDGTSVAMTKSAMKVLGEFAP